MKNNKLICFIVIIFWVLIGVGIFFNPFTSAEYLNVNSGLCVSINDFFGRCALNYKFSPSDILYLMRFTEYFVFGIITTMIVKSYSKSIFKNVCTPLFIGLAVSLAEIYVKSLSGSKMGLYEVITCFAYFCTGLALYIIISSIKPSAKKSYGFKINKYGRKR